MKRKRSRSLSTLAWARPTLACAGLLLGPPALGALGATTQLESGLLTAQAAALNAIFGEMARRSALNMGQYLDAAERYMRLALKAQGQCRATLETLAAIKNPPIVFARQANIAHGPQQVNNELKTGIGNSSYSDEASIASASCPPYFAGS